MITTIDHPGESGPVVDYGALESLDEFREVAGDATIIIALIKNPDGTIGDERCGVYGKETLTAIAHKVIPPQNCIFARFAIWDRELEHLIAAVTVVKGFHEY